MAIAPHWHPDWPHDNPRGGRPGTTSRASGQVLAAPYTVLDFDGFDGSKPETAGQMDRHLADSLALIRWLRDGLFWHLAAILWTGGKSLHAWFRSPARDILESLRNTASPLGLDPGLIGRPEHPCRLPGQQSPVGHARQVKVLFLLMRGF